MYGWCIIPNHLHLALRNAGKLLLSEIIRDFKKYTSVALLKAITANQQESRKEWMLELFRDAAESSNKHQKYKFWQNHYHPVELSDNDKQQRCIDYIHRNPVEAGFVSEPEQYIYSSALDYSGKKGLLDIKFIE